MATTVRSGRKFLFLCMGFLGAAMLSACGLQSDRPAPVVHAGAGAPYSSGIAVADSNETLNSIARRYNLPPEEVAELNHMQSEKRLPYGQRVLLPQPQDYKVKSSDTLFSIARMFRVTTRALAEENHLSQPYRVKEGQVLRIPPSLQDLDLAEAAGTHTGTTGSKLSSVRSGATSSQPKAQTAPSIGQALWNALTPRRNQPQAPVVRRANGDDLLKSPFPEENKKESSISENSKRRFHDLLNELARIPDEEEVPRASTSRAKQSKGAQNDKTGQARRSWMPVLAQDDAVSDLNRKHSSTVSGTKVAQARGFALPDLFGGHKSGASQEYVGQSKRAGFIWPVQGSVISGYGPKAGGLYNDGINIAAQRGAPVLSAADGVVAYAGNKLEGYGNLVLIRHGKGLVTAYAHLSSVAVREGVRVRKGQRIGSVGSSGAVAASQLHFEVRQNGDSRDPKKFMG